MSTGLMIVCLVVSIVLVVLAITKFKVNPAVALILGALLLGALTGLPLVDQTAEDGSVTSGLISVIDNGFGDMLAGIGFPIGFGIILGQMVSDTGGANVIADRMVKIFPESKAMYAVAFAAFILAIPVFFDVTFVILIPIGVALMKKINKGIGYIAGAISIGAAVAHTLVPPTPNPLAAPEYFDFDLGIMIAMGIILGIPIVLISVVIHGKIIDKIGWSAEKDENGNGLNVDEMALPEKLPSFGVSLIPIFLPVVLILLNTVIDAATGSVPAVVEFLGTKTMSMLCGVIAATIISIKFLGLKKTEESANTALQSAGLVFLITGAGGAFAAVITASGVNEAIESMVSNISGNVVIVLLLAYILGLLFRQITGSGTVASLTTFSIMQSVAAVTPIHPVFIALACLSGAMFGATVNDSGFWIVTNMCGFKFSGGVKTYMLGEAIASVVGIILIIIVGLISTLIL